MPDITDFDERLRSGHFEAKWLGRPVVNRNPAPPPPPPDTTIGTVSIGGSRDVNEDDVVTYTASNDGDTTKLSYAWTATGGTAVPSGNSCQVTWGSGPTGKVAVAVTSGDETCTDSPQDKTINITITPTPPPPPPPVNIGNLTISGDMAPTESTNATYAITADGDDIVKAYSWSCTGGTPAGSTTRDTFEVSWGAAGAGKVTCTVSSVDPGVQDSPKTKSEDVVIAVVFSLPSIGAVTFSGPQNPTEKTDASYEAMNDGDASGLEYSWNASGGTINGSKTGKTVDVTLGSAGTLVLQCRVTSSQDGVTDSPVMKESSIPIAMAPAHIGTVTVTGMAQTFVGDEENYTVAFDGNIQSPIYRWSLAGVGGEIIARGGLNDDNVTVRAQSPGGYDVKCVIDADDFYVEDRGAEGKLTVQVQTLKEPEPEPEEDE